MLHSTGRRIASGPIAVRLGLDPALDQVRLAFAIRRDVGTAVRRNRVRRRLREIFAALERTGGLPAGRYLVSVRPAASELTFDALRDHVTRITRQVAA